MITVSAAQLIYTRVELPYSAQRKNGFQTVYKSTSLSSADVSEIEKLVQCFRPNRVELVRHQFFTIKSGKVVLTHTIEIDAHPEITDRTRPGAVLLAHCLILSPAEFSLLDYYPFVLFDNFSFLKSAEEMVIHFGMATGTAPLVEIVVEQPLYVTHLDWPGPEVRKLVALAMQAEESLKKGRVVIFTGYEDNIDKALRLAFQLVQPNYRLACTFDTYIDGCSTEPGRYWAIGTTSLPSGDAFIQISTTDRQVISQNESSWDHKDLYLAWLNHVCSQENFSTSVTHVSGIQLLARAFETRSQIDPVEWDAATCQEFMDLHEQQVIWNLKAILVNMVGKNVAIPLSQYLRETMGIPNILNIAASQYLDPVLLSEYVVTWISHKKPDLKDSHLKDLQDLARRSENTRLLYLTATLGPKVDSKIRDEALSRMNEMTFQQTLVHLMNPIAPANFVTPAHLTYLLADKRLKNMSSEELVDLVEAIVKVNSMRQLDALTPYIKFIESKPLVQLEKIIKKQSNVPPKFEAAVHERREELGSLRRWFDLF